MSFPRALQCCPSTRCPSSKAAGARALELAPASCRIHTPRLRAQPPGSNPRRERDRERMYADDEPSRNSMSCRGTRCERPRIWFNGYAADGIAQCEKGIGSFHGERIT